MEEKIYYTKIIFEGSGYYSWIITLDVNCQKLIFEYFSKGEVTYVYEKKLSNKHIKNLLPYINALDYEPFRDVEDTMQDEGWCGYRDGQYVEFIAFAEPYLPVYRHNMDYLYKEQRPYEKLYDFLRRKYFWRKRFKWVGV